HVRAGHGPDHRRRHAGDAPQRPGRARVVLRSATRDGTPVTSVLVVDDVHASYGRFDVLRGVSLRVASGELVAVLGPNGAGKSTLLTTIAGFLAPPQGSITLDGEAIGGLRPPALLRKGIAYVMQRSSLFPKMTIQENLELGAYVRETTDEVRTDIERVLALFPRLAERRRQRAEGLSGGERRMLEIGRGLLLRPRLLHGGAMTLEIVLQSVVSGLMFGGVIALVAVGISLIWGVMDVINFAYGEYLMWAMYLTFFLYAGAGLDPLVSVPVNALVLFAAGVLTYRLVIARVMRGPIFAQLLSTFGLFVLLRYAAWLLFRPDDRQAQSLVSNGVVKLGELRVSTGELVAFVGSVLATTALFWFLTWTKTGKALRAVAQDREAALALGIEPDRLYAIAWGISAAAAGVAGSLVSSFMYVNPLVGDVFLLPGFAAVALGGFGNVYGAFAGGLVIGIVNVTGGTLTMPKVKL